MVKFCVVSWFMVELMLIMLLLECFSINGIVVMVSVWVVFMLKVKVFVRFLVEVFSSVLGMVLLMLLMMMLSFLKVLMV